MTPVPCPRKIKSSGGMWLLEAGVGRPKEGAEGFVGSRQVLFPLCVSNQWDQPGKLWWPLLVGPGLPSPEFSWSMRAHLTLFSVGVGDMVTPEIQSLPPAFLSPLCVMTVPSAPPQVLCPHGHWASSLPMASDPTGPNPNPFSIRG